jgi:hypothetical protein
MTHPDAQRASELSQLCRSCGACCDGSLFHRARLSPEEVEPARRNGLRVIRDKGFEQPCSQLEDKSCKIYASRPGVCQRFTCKLLARHRDEGGPLEPKLEIVRRFQQGLEKLAQYGVERGPNGDVRITVDGPDAVAARKTLTEVMHHTEESFARAPSNDGPQGTDAPC